MVGVQPTHAVQKPGITHIGPTLTLSAGAPPTTRALIYEELGSDKQLSPTHWDELCSQIRTQLVVDPKNVFKQQRRIIVKKGCLGFPSSMHFQRLLNLNFESNQKTLGAYPKK